MNYIRVGKSGLKLTEITFGSALTIGTEFNDKNRIQELIDTAWDLGIRSFDTSNNYGNAEILLSKALKKYNREEYVISTKGSWPIGETPYHKGLSRKHILWAFEESLRKMELNYVDIYYAHRYDEEVPMEEIVKTFNYLINIGKIRYWATSEWPLEALIECHEVCDRYKLEKPILEQSIYSFAIQKIEKNGVKEFCDKNGVGILGFSPLAQGLLTGKYKNGKIPKDSRIAKSEKINYSKTINIYEQNRERIDKFLEICEQYNLNESSVALQWGIRKKIYPVMGASKPEQLLENIKGLELELPNEIWKKLEEIK
jgi:aldo/keto reductase